MKIPAFPDFLPRRAPGQSAEAKLDALTSLRFIAAIAIVFHHLQDFGFSWRITRALPLDNAVSVFFVLSGFIMFIVHGDMRQKKDRKAYLVARVARIYPLHLATFLLLFILLDRDPNRLGVGEGSVLGGALNILLLQAWVPIGVIFFGYNSVSWTISVEMFFYVAFIFLVVDFARRWPFALAGSALLVIALTVLSDYLHLANYDDPLHRVNSAGLLYVNPLARLFEFVVGMCIGLAYRRAMPGFAGSPLAASRRLATATELVALLLFAGSLVLVTPASEFVAAHLSPSGSDWVYHGGALLPSTALLIFVLALQRGWISSVLRLPGLVLLGEISFAIYLTHQILLRAFAARTDWFTGLSPAAALALYFVALFVTSTLLWRFVEVPARGFIRRAYAKHAAVRPETGNSQAVSKKAAAS